MIRIGVIKGYYDEENLILVDEIAREWGVISMTYLHKASFENGIMRYEYGIVKGVYIGAIEFRVDVDADASGETRGFKLIFYDDNSFNGVTAQALQGVASFIRQNNFPDDYLRATH